MIDISKLSYRVFAILKDNTQVNITGAITAGGWGEGEKELSARATATLANVEYKGKPLSSTIVPNTIIVVMASGGGAEKEVYRGYVTDWGHTSGNRAKNFTITVYDELFCLQQSQDDRYIPAGTGTKSALTAIFDDWGVPIGDYKGPNKNHAKTLYKAQYLSDIILSLLDDAEKHGADRCVVRASAGKVHVLPIGSNKEIFHFTEEDNATTTSDKLSSSGMVTRVKIMGLADDEGKASPEAIVDGLLEYGVRQRIYNRSEDDSLDTAKAAAQAILDEEGGLQRTSTVETPDVPFIRKGDLIHLDTEAMTGFFFVTSIDHDIVNRKMTMTVKLDESQKEGG